MFLRESQFLNLSIKPIDGELNTDLFDKPTDTHQFLDLTSSYPYHCKKLIPYCHDLRLNSICLDICSDKEKSNKRCNDLEKWLMERGYN